MLRQTLLPVLTSVVLSLGAAAAHAADPQVERGKYLATIGGCTDCHTPGHFLGHPDMARYLGGSDVGFGSPMGVFVGPNLTPDKETGLGKWTSQQIVTAITTGKRPDGRILAPMMPWRGLSVLTTPDALAIAAFLKSLPPVSNKVPGPFGPNEPPTVLVMSVQPAAAYTPPKTH
jgi:mono/diheme cytochrome c family protein